MQKEYWFVLIGALAVVALSVLLATSIWRRRRPDLSRALTGVAIDAVHDVLVPNGMGGQIHIEYLLLTAHGVLVVDVKPFEGIIFGSDRMDEWTVMAKNRRFTFPNPQVTLYDRVAAIKRLVRDVPVQGHVLFSSAANFSKGRPGAVILGHEFVEQYRKPDRVDLEQARETFWPQWQRIREALQPADVAA